VPPTEAPKYPLGGGGWKNWAINFDEIAEPSPGDAKLDVAEDAQKAGERMEQSP
jgi:hypothetical protein